MMGRTLFSLALLAVFVLVECSLASAAPAPKAKRTPETIARAEKAVKDYLEKLGGAAAARVQYIKDDAVESAFPQYYVFSVLFPQYPLARVTPKGLKSSNLFAVDADGKVATLTDAKELEKFFHEHLAAKEEAALKTAIQSWLRLAQQYHQDGFFTFAIMDDSIKIGDKTAAGTVVAMKGGSGTLSARLTFDEDGKLSKVSEEAKLRPGPRPICQATKLLDKDPLIRRIVEQDLLIMGTAARDYLDEQRAQASPELRRAIDRLWQRIVDAER
jgi:hypothetical protein